MPKPRPLVAREVPRAVFSVALVVQRGGVASAAHLPHQRLGLKMYFKAARIVEVQGRDNLAVLVELRERREIAEKTKMSCEGQGGEPPKERGRRNSRALTSQRTCSAI